jgi:hypothetical protein
MKFTTKYLSMHQCWAAIAHDETGSLGDAAFGDTEKEAVFHLGIMFGRHPARFARPLAELLRDGE